MPVYSLIIINKAGGLIYQREFQPGLLKLSTNDYLVLAGTFHGIHAITRSITPKIPNLTIPSTSTTPNPSSSTPSHHASASTATSAVLSPSSTSASTPAGGTQTPTAASPSPHPTSSSSSWSYPNPSVPVTGLETLETEKFRLTCFQTLTGTKFLLFTDPGMPNVEGVMKSVYELYADYVMKNPFYQLEMPVRCEGFDRGLGGFLRGRA